MGILDGYPFDTDTGGAAPPGWLGLALGAPAAVAGSPDGAKRLPGPVLAQFAQPALGLNAGYALTPARSGAKDAAPRGTNYLAPGVRRLDSTLTGEKFLQQFSPEVQAAVKAVLAGGTLPAADPRPGFAQAIAAIARKYARAAATPDPRSDSAPSGPQDLTE